MSIEMDPPRAHGIRPVVAAMRSHAALLGFLLAALVVRLAVELAYAPALFFSDSWVYLRTTFTGVPVGIVPSRPSGYPLLLRLLTAPGRDVLLVSVLQHVSGLAVGVLVYVVLGRLGLRRVLAALAAGIVMLDAYAIALEQFILAEAFFTLLLFGALALTVTRRDSPRALTIAGALLAGACLLRPSALFVIPVWLIYLLWRARERRRLLLALTGLLVPLLLYASWHALRTDGSFNLDQTRGWFLYGRVAHIADCRGAEIPAAARSLCAAPALMRREFSPGDWIWAPDSPPELLSGGNPDFYAGKPGGPARTARYDALLQAFSLAIIRAHPLPYARAVGLDFLRFFAPEATPHNDPDGVTVAFPGSPLYGWLYGSERDRYLPGYFPRVRWPAPLLLRYQKLFPGLRLLVGALSLVACVAVLGPLLTRRRIRTVHAAEIFLLTGSGLAMLFASAVLVAFVVRYLIPAIPLLLCGGLLALDGLLQAAFWRAPPGAAAGGQEASSGGRTVEFSSPR